MMFVCLDISESVDVGRLYDHWAQLVVSHNTNVGDNLYTEVILYSREFVWI